MPARKDRCALVDGTAPFALFASLRVNPIHPSLDHPPRAPAPDLPPSPPSPVLSEVEGWTPSSPTSPGRSPAAKTSSSAFAGTPTASPPQPPESGSHKDHKATKRPCDFERRRQAASPNAGPRSPGKSAPRAPPRRPLRAFVPLCEQKAAFPAHGPGPPLRLPPSRRDRDLDGVTQRSPGYKGAAPTPAPQAIPPEARFRHPRGKGATRPPAAPAPSCLRAFVRTKSSLSPLAGQSRYPSMSGELAGSEECLEVLCPYAHRPAATSPEIVFTNKHKGTLNGNYSGSAKIDFSHLISTRV